MTWQPIETAPKKTEVLVSGKNDAVCLGILVRRHPYLDDEYSASYEWYLHGNRRDGIGEPTHWMPKPEAASKPNN